MTEKYSHADHTPRRPPIDAELIPAMQAMKTLLPTISHETLDEFREVMANGLPGQEPDDYTAAGKVLVEELVIPGSEPGLELAMTVLKPADGSGPWPLIYHTHGGGMVLGTRFTGFSQFIPYAADGSAVVASIEYRLAPENPDPAPITDCYTGLVWLARNAAALDVDPDHIIITGGSAGGGLAAGTALMARDRGFPRLTHQILNQPMLDDRLHTHSARMLDREGIWDRHDNLFGWVGLLGERRGTDDVSYYAAPARAQDLTDLPRTFIDVGSVESFRDEAVEYAMRLSQAGVSVDLHVWGGGVHGFDTFPQSALSQAATATRDEYFRRALER
ncbi:alpha/beta hydrolase [Nocardia sp. A7]|uniref:alpha/beta hydrolase n=1 Tax=Nocardia sp. A7 TaxID=2789274 RepID=UPI00397BAFF8